LQSGLTTEAGLISISRWENIVFAWWVDKAEDLSDFENNSASSTHPTTVA